MIAWILEIRIERLLERLCKWLAWRLPRRLVYFAALRVLSEVTRREDLSHVGRELHQGEIRMLWAIEQWWNRPR